MNAKTIKAKEKGVGRIGMSEFIDKAREEVRQRVSKIKPRVEKLRDKKSICVVWGILFVLFICALTIIAYFLTDMVLGDVPNENSVAIFLQVDLVLFGIVITAFTLSLQPINRLVCRSERFLSKYLGKIKRGIYLYDKEIFDFFENNIVRVSHNFGILKFSVIIGLIDFSVSIIIGCISTIDIKLRIAFLFGNMLSLIYFILEFVVKLIFLFRNPYSLTKEMFEFNREYAIKYSKKDKERLNLDEQTEIVWSIQQEIEDE